MVLLQTDISIHLSVYLSIYLSVSYTHTHRPLGGVYYNNDVNVCPSPAGLEVSERERNITKKPGIREIMGKGILQFLPPPPPPPRFSTLFQVLEYIYHGGAILLSTLVHIYNMEYGSWGKPPLARSRAMIVLLYNPKTKVIHIIPLCMGDNTCID